jgi:hypothetical protein
VPPSPETRRHPAGPRRPSAGPRIPTTRHRVPPELLRSALAPGRLRLGQVAGTLLQAAEAEMEARGWAAGRRRAARVRLRRFLRAHGDLGGPGLARLLAPGARSGTALDPRLRRLLRRDVLGLDGSAEMTSAVRAPRGHLPIPRDAG